MRKIQLGIENGRHPAFLCGYEWPENYMTSIPSILPLSCLLFLFVVSIFSAIQSILWLLLYHYWCHDGVMVVIIGQWKPACFSLLNTKRVNFTFLSSSHSLPFLISRQPVQEIWNLSNKNELPLFYVFFFFLFSCKTSVMSVRWCVWGLRLFFKLTVTVNPKSQADLTGFQFKILFNDAFVRHL